MYLTGQAAALHRVPGVIPKPPLFAEAPPWIPVPTCRLKPRT